MDCAGGAREERAADWEEKGAGEHVGGLAGLEGSRRAICVVQDRDGVTRVLENIAYVMVVCAWHLTYVRGALSNKHSKEKVCK